MPSGLMLPPTFCLDCFDQLGAITLGKKKERRAGALTYCKVIDPTVPRIHPRKRAAARALSKPNSSSVEEK
jgi:hypothetical protein